MKDHDLKIFQQKGTKVHVRDIGVNVSSVVVAVVFSHVNNIKVEDVYDDERYTQQNNHQVWDKLSLQQNLDDNVRNEVSQAYQPTPEAPPELELLHL